MGDRPLQFHPERVDSRGALRLLAGEQPLSAVLADAEKNDRSDGGEGGGEEEASHGHRGLHEFRGLPWSWSAAARTFQVRQLNHCAMAQLTALRPRACGVPFRLDRASEDVSASADDVCTVASTYARGQSRLLSGGALRCARSSFRPRGV